VEVAGEPELVAACSCGECQRQTGSAVNVSAYWLREQVQVTGTATSYTRRAQSGGTNTLHFCPNCGSTVYWELNDLKPEWIAVGVGMFVDPQFPRPSVSVWEATKHGWLSIPAEFHFDGQPQP